MKGTLLILSLILVILCPIAVSAQTIPARYWSDAWRGWHFYEDPEPDAEDRPAPPPRIASPAAQAQAREGAGDRRVRAAPEVA